MLRELLKDRVALIDSVDDSESDDELVCELVDVSLSEMSRVEDIVLVPLKESVFDEHCELVAEIVGPDNDVDVVVVEVKVVVVDFESEVESLCELLLGTVSERVLESENLLENELSD